LRNPIFLQSPQKSIAAGLAYLPRAPGVHVAIRLFCDSPFPPASRPLLRLEAAAQVEPYPSA
jgi:hypothetical protein